MQQSTERLSRRVVLQGLAGLIVTLSIEGCAQSTASPTPTPTPHASGRVLVEYRGHTMRVTTVAWSPDSRYIASGSLDKTVQIWAASSSDHFHPFIYRGHSADVNTVDWSPDSQRVVSGSSDKTVQIWDALSGENVVTGRGHTDAVTAVVT